MKDKNTNGAHSNLKKNSSPCHEFPQILGQSAALKEVLDIISQVADTHANVLIQGDSGTGKELVARAIHCNSSRREKPFVTVNTSAIPENLLESEMFGHEKGAYTGADRSKLGKFELAEGGTIFLDEIGDMSLLLQGKILRAIQFRELEHLGGTKVNYVDVRILAATNKHLLPLIEQGKFRGELYYRLNIVNICLPPLRERRGDIPILANHFIKKYVEREHKDIEGICLSALEVLDAYHWPGNVRELENVIERAVILCPEKKICIPYLPTEIIGPGRLDLNRVHNFNDSVTEFKKLLITRTLQETQNNKAEAARRLGLNRTYFFRLLKQLQIQ